MDLEPNDRMVIADRETKCTFCKKPIHIGDEMGFGIIKNRNRFPPERYVPQCAECQQREWSDMYGPYDG